MKYFLMTIFTLGFVQSFACTNDFQCGAAHQCVKPNGSYSVEGVCVTVTNSYGTPDYTQSQQPTVHQVHACSFDTDCGVGAACLKRGTDIKGICVKD